MVGAAGTVEQADALPPTSGESVKAIHPPRIELVVKDGFVIPPRVAGNPPPPRDVPQSLRTFTESINPTHQAITQTLLPTYILAVGKGQSPVQADFYPLNERAKACGWTTLILKDDHNLQRSHPQELVRLREQAPQ